MAYGQMDFSVSVFDEFDELIIPAKFYPVDRTNPLGNVQGEPVNVNIIIDEGVQTVFTGQIVDSLQNDILIYAERTSVLGSRSCIGGYIQTLDNVDPHKFRIENWNVAGYTRDDGHIELTATEVSS